MTYCATTLLVITSGKCIIRLAHLAWLRVQQFVHQLRVATVKLLGLDHNQAFGLGGGRGRKRGCGP